MPLPLIPVLLGGVGALVAKKILSDTITTPPPIPTPDMGTSEKLIKKVVEKVIEEELNKTKIK